MRHSAVLFFILVFSLSAFSQPPKKNKVTKPKPSANQNADEKAEFEKAINEPDAALKIAALQKFMQDFPASKEIVRAQESIVSARGVLGENALKTGDAANGIEFFKLAVKDSPAPMSEKLFADIVLQFPTNLFLRGQRDAAREIAVMIEEKTGSDAKQILGLATFYIGIENATNARRLALKAIEIAPEMPAAYQTLGIANRLGFRLDEAVAAYTKAIELDPVSLVSKRSLAEMKRANGKAGEATILYREILEKDALDANAKTGFILSLFESGKQAEAETEMEKSLAVNANNLPLLVGAAYFYAGHLEGGKAVELAQKVLAIEPRYTWASIALARGLLAQKRSLDAEKVLLTARAFGNFPTLDYEIASARLQAGLYREAAEELRKNFAVKNGVLETYLGNRVGVEAEDFLKLLSLERRAAIFSFEPADTLENAEQLKSLLEFARETGIETANETAISEAADKFVKGDDRMKIHRQLFVAGRLLDVKRNLPKVIEMTQGAIKGVDTALDVPNPSAAVMADELYNARTYAISRGEYIIVPDVPRQKLSAILRGRIEELSGWTLYQQDKTADAVVKLKRAVSVLPENSNWWRTSVWRLGAALEADGKTNEALENYIKSYKSGETNAAKYFVIETLYQKVNGSSDGLEEKIGKQPEGIGDTIAKINENTNSAPPISPTVQATPTPTETVTENTEKIEEPKNSNTENPPQTETTPAPPPETSPVPTPEIISENPSTETKNETVSENPSTIQTATPAPEIVNPVVQTPEATPTPAQIIQSQISNEPPKNNETVAKTAAPPKSIFDPIVITVGKPETPKTKIVTEEKTAAPPKTEETETTKSAESEKIEPKNTDEISMRPRVIIEDNLKIAETPVKCEIVASQESIWLINGGGSLGILIGFSGNGDAAQIKAVSSSPRDVEVSMDAEISAASGRAFFILKSISTKKGAFTVTFNAPCGRKEIQVRVR